MTVVDVFEKLNSAFCSTVRVGEEARIPKFLVDHVRLVFGSGLPRISTGTKVRHASPAI